MRRRFFLLTALLSSSIASVALVGCSHTEESAGSDKLTSNVGIYPAPPQGVNRPRVGVPPFNVQTSSSSFSGGDINDLAADQMTTLLDQYGGFKVIERAQLQQLIKEQSLEGIVADGEMAKQGHVRGVDYLLLGKVTNLRVKKDDTGHSFSLATLGGVLGGAAVNNSKQVITTECGVDVRMVNPTTGELAWSNFSEYKRTDSAEAMGLAILGASAQSNADVQLSEDDKGKVLRLALDDSLKKSMPKISKFLQNQPATPAATPTAAP